MHSKSRIKIVDGDLLDFPSKYIAHQCNCRSKNVAGLANSIFKKFPWADITKEGRDIKQLATIDIRGNGEDKRYVINMFSQFYPGLPRESGKDTINERKRNFLLCLKQIKNVNNLESIAFPYGIGCGLSGGDWEWYSMVLEVFANEIPEVEVFLVRK